MESTRHHWLEELHHHWLDEVFEKPEEAASRFQHHPQAIAAFQAAEAAYRERQRSLDESPAAAAGSPTQAARQAFLRALQQAR